MDRRCRIDISYYRPRCLILSGSPSDFYPEPWRGLVHHLGKGPSGVDGDCLRVHCRRSVRIEDHGGGQLGLISIVVPT